MSVNLESGIESSALSVPLLQDDWAKTCIARTETTLDRLLPPCTLSPIRLHEAMRYAVFAGGKRIRPMLCYAAGELTGAADDALAEVAASIEMIHVFSLIQDDLPVMDNDALRHGKPTVHVQYDEATALLVCDALLSLAFLTLSEAPLAGQYRAALTRELALAGGSQGLSGGQFIDLASVGKPLCLSDLESMHRLKTGALIRAAVRMGALCAGGEQPGDTQLYVILDDYAEVIGLAFQVVDDILDVSGNTATLGKTAGKDAAADKPTYVSLLGLDATRQFAEVLRSRAYAALESLGSRADRLRSLADWVVDRVY